MSRRLLLLLVALAPAQASFTAGERPAPRPAAPELRSPTGAVSAAQDRAVASAARHIAGYRTGLAPFEVRNLAEALVAESRARGIDPAWVLALIHVESRFYNFAVSRVGALGLMQLRPATAREFAARTGVPWHGPLTLFDPVANVRIGIAYLAWLRARYGSLEAALAAYNWGPGRIDGRLARGRGLPTGYVRQVAAAPRP